MRDQGWFDKEGVKILEGKWQDFVESEELLGTGGFDVIYTDTFSEDYAGMSSVVVLPRLKDAQHSMFLDLHRFFGHVPDLLEGPDSRFGFFNGLGATSTYLDLRLACGLLSDSLRRRCHVLRRLQAGIGPAPGRCRH